MPSRSGSNALIVSTRNSLRLSQWFGAVLRRAVADVERHHPERLSGLGVAVPRTVENRCSRAQTKRSIGNLSFRNQASGGREPPVASGLDSHCSRYSCSPALRTSSTPSSSRFAKSSIVDRRRVAVAEVDLAADCLRESALASVTCTRHFSTPFSNVPPPRTCVEWASTPHG